MQDILTKQVFFPKGNLPKYLDIKIIDGNQHISHRYCYHYDKYGNVLNELPVKYKKTGEIFLEDGEPFDNIPISLLGVLVEKPKTKIEKWTITDIVERKGSYKYIKDVLYQLYDVTVSKNGSIIKDNNPVIEEPITEEFNTENKIDDTIIDNNTNTIKVGENIIEVEELENVDILNYQTTMFEM